MELSGRVDTAVLVGVLAFAYFGARRGLVQSVLDLAIDALVFLVAVANYRLVGDFLAGRFQGAMPFVVGYSFLGIVVVGELVTWLIRGFLGPPPIDKWRDADRTQFPGIVAGCVVGALRTFGAATCALIAVYAFPEAATWRDVATHAYSTRQVLLASTYLPSSLKLPLGTGPTDAVLYFTPASVPVDAIPIPTSAGSPGRPDGVSEIQLLDMTNLARRQSGLAALAADPRLSAMARDHTTEMATLAVLFHDSPTNGSITVRLRENGIAFEVSAENVAFSWSLEGAFNGLIQSPEHRRNIMSPDFHRVGVSVSRTDPSGFLVTQDFTD